MNTNNLNKRKIQKDSRGHLVKLWRDPKPQSIPEITYFTHPEMIVGVHAAIGEKYYWNNRMEVLLEANYKGYWYMLGLEEFKSQRSLVLRINNFVKYIINDNK